MRLLLRIDAYSVARRAMFPLGLPKAQAIYFAIECVKVQTVFRAATHREQRRIALLSQGGKVFVMEMFGFDHPAPDDPEDDYDLLVLNCIVLLDALRRENASLRCRILAHWKTFQSL